MRINRRSFLVACLGSLFLSARQKNQILTINGPIRSSKMGITLIHEHFLVDFIGADKINFSRWDREEVISKVLPYLFEVKNYGVKTIFDCTPAYLGRDVILLKELSQRSGLNIITNTGYYGARQNQHLPPHAFSESAQELANRWVDEFIYGIDGTDIKPGFIKIGVDANEQLSAIHQKLIKAAAITHLKTGLTICSHTGPAKTAFEQLNILKTYGVSPEAFVWVHAQNEKNKDLFIEAASVGTWVSLDGIGWGDFDNYADSLMLFKQNKLLHRVLISHDAGWYKPEDPEGDFVGYTNVFKELYPRLIEKGFTRKELNQLLVQNPISAFTINVRRT
jgi:phosphotriesterase-related protein